MSQRPSRSHPLASLPDNRGQRHLGARDAPSFQNESFYRPLSLAAPDELAGHAQKVPNTPTPCSRQLEGWLRLDPDHGAGEDAGVFMRCSQLSLIAVSLALPACAATAYERPGESVEPYEPPPHETAQSAASHEPATSPGAPPGQDAPEISRSVGTPGGVLVLWPRIVVPRGGPAKPDTETVALAGRMQQRLAVLAKRARPGAAIEVRPEPERVCPRKGCQAMSIGLLLTRAGAGCAAIALVSGPGTAPAELVPWAGEVRLSASSVPFREPPERALGVTDYVRCSDLEHAAEAQDGAVQGALAKAR